ncbi:AAA ATPase domain containing protein [Nitzschia inconspicua]|uniref:AAA ATPase domain containing protein n=1 Tax=Nitzschia inconspicua TaxID=303405 RepID=A0A9K3K6H2_9STRA|nr:AAA ATPase domain containing protein [Nitzschia inconspicua]KAG7344480.1 AAA ATPase domain containing protein [Nitzschia inconspicua]
MEGLKLSVTGDLGPCLDPKSASISSSFVWEKKSFKKSSNVPSMTIDQLRFSELQLHGRDKERRLLLDFLRENYSMDGKNRHENHKYSHAKKVVLVSGVSGVGKTRLIQDILTQPVEVDMCGVFAIGKYDLQQQTAEPYLGIVSACQEMLQKMVDSDGTNSLASPETLDGIRADLLNDLGQNGLSILVRILPMVSKILGVGEELNLESSTETDGILEQLASDEGKMNEAKAKLHFAFRIFFRTFCKHLPLVVLALDDLQWADTASIVLLSDLLGDRALQNLMLIFLYRSDESDSATLIANISEELRDKASKQMVKLLKLDVGRLFENDVNSIILDLLSMDSSTATLDLAALCCRRTGGNVFFLLAFLRMLKDNGYLEYNFGLLKWTWDLEKIESETVATTNVVELTKCKMSSFSKDYQTLLALSSCLGHSFEKKDLDIVSCGKYSTDDFLAVAQEEGMLELLAGRKSMWYCWTHDSIQEAAASLIPTNESLKFKYDVGKLLLSGISEKHTGRYLFVILGLLNPFALTTDNLPVDERLQLASLNYLASTQSSKLSSISSTSNFVKSGIAFLPEGHWQSHTELSLGLFTIATEVEAAQMHEQAMNWYASKVIQQDHLTILDKLRVYRAQIQYWGMKNDDKSVELCLAALDQLGCRFPRSSILQTISLIFSLMKYKRELKKITIQEISNLPVVTSQKIREMGSMLNELSLHAYGTGETTLSGLCTMKQLSITLEKGINGSSYYGFVTLAPFFIVAFNDLKATSQIASYADAMRVREHGNLSTAGFNMVQGCFNLPWAHTWSHSLSVLREGYKNGMREGQLRNGLYCIVASLWTCFIAQVHLPTLKSDIEVYMRQTIELDTGLPLNNAILLKRSVEILLDDSEQVEGRQSLLDEARSLIGDDKFNGAMANVFQGQIYYATGEHQKGTALAIKTGILLKKLLSASANMPSIFHQSFSLYVSAQDTKSWRTRRRFRSLAKKRHDILRKWAKDGCPNVVHYVAILDSELAILNGLDKKVVEDLYQKAIVLSARGGMILDAAVANERLGRFFEGLGDTIEAGRRFEQAIQYYEDYGLMSRGMYLHKQYRDHISSWSLR